MVQRMSSLLVFWILVQLSESTEIDSLNITYQTEGWFASLKGSQNSLDISLGFNPNTRSVPCPESPNLVQCFQNPEGKEYVTIRRVDTGFSTAECFEIESINQDSNKSDCISLGTDHWYGGQEMAIQRWPIKNMDFNTVPYVTGDFGFHNLGGIMESLWISSSGFLVYVDRATPLFLSFNQSGNSKMCLSSSYDEYPYNGVGPETRSKKLLKFTICSTDNVREAYQVSYSRWLKKPIGVVDPKVITRPIWSTWAKFKKSINQAIAVEFAREIVANGFKGSHLEIDDMWETCYGELQFDQNKFPNASDMVKQIHQLGFTVSLWVHPYTNIKCPSFNDPTVRPYFIKSAITGEPLSCFWWNGMGGYIDTTNPKARDYFVKKLKQIQTTTGVDTFKFDSGEVDYIPKNFMLSDTSVMATPNEFTRHFVEIAASFGPSVEVRVAYNTQHLPVLVRMMDRYSGWDYHNGLQTLIPTALFMSIIGYPFILPDMIGGNNYFHQALPEKELFIRWLQVNVFMPALQFSIAPWDYDQEVVNISLAMVTLHEQYAPLINQLAQEASETGNPIVRPLWWIAPKDPDAQSAEQQFLLGESVLVAPVVEQGATTRDIYLPNGKWQDQISPERIHTGPIWLRNYTAELSQLPFFIRKE